MEGDAVQDVLAGGPGNDEIRAQNGEPDRVDGGPGFDVCPVDQVDVVRNCEQIEMAEAA